MFCCEALAKEVESHPPFAAGGFLYPPNCHPTGQIEYCEGNDSWNVNGCCGGGCYILENIKFCPFCGTRLPIKE